MIEATFVRVYGEIESGRLDSLLHGNLLGRMSFFKITLIRSGIGMTERQNGVLKALGLRKRMKTVYHPVTPQTAGMIMKVKELLAVSEVDKPLTQKEVHEKRRPPKGFIVEKPLSSEATAG